MSRIVQECTRLKKKAKRLFEGAKLRRLAWSSCAIGARGCFASVSRSWAYAKPMEFDACSYRNRVRNTGKVRDAHGKTQRKQRGNRM